MRLSCVARRASQVWQASCAAHPCRMCHACQEYNARSALKTRRACQERLTCKAWRLLRPPRMPIRLRCVRVVCRAPHARRTRCLQHVLYAMRVASHVACHGRRVGDVVFRRRHTCHACRGPCFCSLGPARLPAAIRADDGCGVHRFAFRWHRVHSARVLARPLLPASLGTTAPPHVVDAIALCSETARLPWHMLPPVALFPSLPMMQRL